MSLQPAMADREAATYVLAYLLRRQYQCTATAFLQECSVLPSKSLLVLPETPLEAIVTEYRAHRDTRLLVDTLGEEGTWTALWDKMEQTMAQLRRLSEELRSHHSTTARKGAVRKRTRTHWPIPQPQPPAPSQHYPSPLSQSTLPETQLQPPTAHTHAQSSPQKRKSAPPRRMPATAASLECSLESHVPETMPTDMQQVLETMLGSGNLPEKLADIINRVVGSETKEDEGSSQSLDLSPGTLDSILDLTCAQPEFEGVLGPLDPPHVARRAVEVRVLGPQQPHPPNKECEEPSCKHPRVSSPQHSLPPGIDIESFLDHLHS